MVADHAGRGFLLLAGLEEGKAEVGEYVCEGVAPLGLRWLALGRRAGAHRALGLLGRGL